MRFDDLSKVEEERATDVYRKAIVIDAQQTKRIERVKTKDTEEYNEFFKAMHGSGLTVAINSPIRGLEGRVPDFFMTINYLNELYSMIDECSDKIMLAITVADIRKAKREGKVAIVIGGMRECPIGDDLRLLETFYRLGLRQGMLSWNERSLAADGCLERTNSGLSDFGVELVKEMNRLGIVLDMAHSGEASSMEAIEFSKDPIIFSHNNTRTFYDVGRNKSDESIKALAEKGGVFGVSPMVSSLGAGVKKPVEEVSIEDMLDNLDYVVNLVGVDHAGFGSDGLGVEPFKLVMGWYAKKYGARGVPYPGIRAKGLDTVSKMPNLARGLVARGYSDQEITKILGGNFLRVYKKVWA